jgi:hypothetical protein
MLALGFEVLTSIGGAEKAQKPRREEEEDLLLIVGKNPCRDEKLEEGEEWRNGDTAFGSEPSSDK